MISNGVKFLVLLLQRMASKVTNATSNCKIWIFFNVEIINLFMSKLICNVKSYNEGSKKEPELILLFFSSCIFSSRMWKLLISFFSCNFPKFCPILYFWYISQHTDLILLKFLRFQKFWKFCKSFAKFLQTFCKNCKFQNFQKLQKFQKFQKLQKFCKSSAKIVQKL